MEKLKTAFRTINFVEIVLMLSVFVSLMVRFGFDYQATFFMQIFAIALTLVYFPFGFYFIKKPSENYTKSTSIVLGLIYAMGILTILVSAMNIDSYRYPVMFDFAVLLGLSVYLIFQLRKDKFPDTYVNTQFIRVIYIVICNLFILFK